MISVKKLSVGGNVQRAGLMDIARRSSEKMQNSDLYVKVLNILDDICHDSSVYKMRGFGSKTCSISRTKLRELIHGKYFSRFETSIGLGSAIIVYTSVGEI